MVRPGHRWTGHHQTVRTAYHADGGHHAGVKIAFETSPKGLDSRSRHQRGEGAFAAGLIFDISRNCDGNNIISCFMGGLQFPLFIWSSDPGWFAILGPSWRPA